MKLPPSICTGDPKMRERLSNLGAVPMTMPAAEFGKLIHPMKPRNVARFSGWLA